jgi:hypothetical protein
MGEGKEPAPAGAAAASSERGSRPASRRSSRDGDKGGLGIPLLPAGKPASVPEELVPAGLTAGASAQSWRATVLWAG